MDVRPLALARAAHRNDAIVVNMESDCFDIVFINNGLPAVIHTISPRADGATIEDNVHRLADELTKTAAFYQSNHPDVQLNGTLPLLLAGEMAADTATSQMLQAEIEYQIEPLVPPVDFPDKLPLSSYTTSIGLATKRTILKSVDHGSASRFFDIDVNILDGKYRKPKARPIPVKHWLLTSLVIIVIGCLFPLYQAKSQIAAENHTLDTVVNNIFREINLAALVNEEALITQGLIDETLAAVDGLAAANVNIFSPRGKFNTNLQTVTFNMPPATSFTSIEIKKDLIVIKGETDSVFTVIEYVTALEAQGVFQQVRVAELDEALITIPGIAEDGSDSYQVNVITFEIEARLPPPGQETP
jgi:hypothetical protein